MLWSRGPSTVRDVHEAVAGRKATQYTTVLKLLQIMAGIGAGPPGREAARACLRGRETSGVDAAPTGGGLATSGVQRIGPEPDAGGTLGAEGYETGTGRAAQTAG